MNTKLPNGTIILSSPPSITGAAAVGGKKEAEGPLKEYFSYIAKEGHFGQTTWEKAEMELQKEALQFAVDSDSISLKDIDYIFSGDLLNQCIASSFAHRSTDTAFLGMYGACSTFAEGLGLSALFVNAGYASYAATCVSSHFCSAERQYRFPMEYGGQRPPTAQWTVTGAGCTIIGPSTPDSPHITSVLFGAIVDAGITDANNMGAAMAPAAYDTISKFFEDTHTSPSDYDLILTGDLGEIGKDILIDLFRMENGIDISKNYMDCGVEIYDRKAQDVNSGGSGAGCSASVFSGFIVPEIKKGRWSRVLFAGTGALLSPLSSQQGESIPGICHAVCIN